MPRVTGWQRLLEVLQDGRPHSHHELYRLGIIVHSRVSDLRKRGYGIELWREDDAYWYRLVARDSVPGGACSTVSRNQPLLGSDCSPPPPASPERPPVAPAAQQQLELLPTVQTRPVWA